MFKIKALVIGGVLNLTVLFFLFSIVSALSLKMGIFEDETYLILGITMFSIASFISGFSAGKIAGERVLLHGLLAGVINLLTALIIFLILANGNITVFFVRSLLIIVFSLCGSFTALFTERKSQYL